MDESHKTMAEQVAHAVRDFQQQRTGHAPKSVTVVFSEGTPRIRIRRWKGRLPGAFAVPLAVPVVAITSSLGLVAVIDAAAILLGALIVGAGAVLSVQCRRYDAA